MAAEVYFKWDDKLKLDVKPMDDEHKKLITLMNDLHVLKTANAPFNQVQTKLTELANFTVAHFNHEEQYFSSIPYARAEAHKNIHKELLTKLKEHAAKIQTQQKVGDDFFLFLKVWLSAHIMGIDAGYAPSSVKPKSA